MQQLRVLLLCSSKYQYKSTSIGDPTLTLAQDELPLATSVSAYADLCQRAWTSISLTLLISCCSGNSIFWPPGSHSGSCLWISTSPHQNTNLPLKLYAASLHYVGLSVEYIVSLLCTHRTGKTSSRPYYPCPSLIASKLLNHFRLHTTTLEFDFPAISNSWWLQVCYPTPIEFLLIVSRWGFNSQD